MNTARVVEFENSQDNEQLAELLPSPNRGVSNDQEGKAEIFHLWWYDLETKKNMPAGVAFFDPKFGEYRLRIDVHPETAYYLRPISTNGERTYYRVEVVLKKEGRFAGRKVIGDGHQTPETHNDIYIHFGPYTKVLILGVKK